MKKSQKKIAFNKSLKLWELHSPDAPDNIEFVKTKSQATKWLKGELDNGNCYEVAGKFILESNSKTEPSYKDLHLCHGTVHGQGPLSGAIFGHSWLEYAQELPTAKLPIVLDKSNGKNLEIPAPLYYLMGKIDISRVKKYNQEQTRKNILEHGHWGPW